MVMAQQQQVEMEMVFKKVLTGPSLKPRTSLSISGRALRLLPEFQAPCVPIEVEVFDIEGVGHTLAFSKRWTGPDDKPTILQRSWVPFAARKGLIAGDQLILYRIRDEVTGDHSYQVRVKRVAFNLLGAPIWVDLERLLDLPPPAQG